ncbi:F-box only protein 25 isoform X1 [Solea solea]|uniref:F-box only protein 25 isoform X1 n=1 Tax=Solea solea TaxID=90069 RepID=UPI00272CE99B|nr:F-box only protein 25 isoform X1 [Solea solea]XP_058469866.1 F-box only protein 25 isoform X1 [Solea solea]XP_058469867.1 F-box only protein 25 isoform X1 [Solea solea]XP_058469868.1 F-box only protein 25 isoform X1 [Solea solea]
MPFLGKDWRSPGLSWTKTEHGWTRTDLCGHKLQDNNRVVKSSQVNPNRLCSGNQENVLVEDVCELATTKRKKEFHNNNTKSQFVYSDKWIYVLKGYSKERPGYCTLGEALNRLDFSVAIQDLRRFDYVAKLFQLIARSKLSSLSGAAQKNYFNILEKIVRKVLDDHYNPRLVRELLQDLSLTLQDLNILVGQCVLVGNVNIWCDRIETIQNWQQQLNNLQVPEKLYTGISFDDLPLHMQNKIFFNLSNACDIVSLGKASSSLLSLSENPILWKELCHFHFSDKEFCRNLVLTKADNLDWKLMYFTLKKYYPMREQYGDTLHFCKHCHVLFWKDHHLAVLLKDSGHPCTVNDPDSCVMPVSPQHFIDLFQF